MRKTLIAISMVLVMLALVAVGNAYAEETLFEFTDAIDAGCTCYNSAQAATSCRCGKTASSSRKACTCAGEDNNPPVDTLSAEQPQDDGALDAEMLADENGGMTESSGWESAFGTDALRMESNMHVKNLQVYLNIYHRCIRSVQASSEELPHDALYENGIYDERTRDAVLSFQQDQGLEANGEATEETKQKLFDLIGTLPLSGFSIIASNDSPNG